MTWFCKLGIIASNKLQHVYVGGENEIVNGNDMTMVLYYAILSLFAKLLIMVYIWPIKIANDPKSPRGFGYLCTAKFWKSCSNCCEDE